MHKLMVMPVSVSQSAPKLASSVTEYIVIVLILLSKFSFYVSERSQSWQHQHSISIAAVVFHNSTITIAFHQSPVDI